MELAALLLFLNMSTSHYSSPQYATQARRTDGADTITPAWLKNPDLPENVRRTTRRNAACWLFVGVALLLADGAALAHFADSTVEAVILALLCMPTGLFVIAAGLEARR